MRILLRLFIALILCMGISAAAFASAATTIYRVQKGDTIRKIAQQHHTTIELIKISNHLIRNQIHPGQQLRIWTPPLTIYVDKSDNVLTVMCDNQIVKTYSVSTGANNITPVGTFTITSRLKHPTWFKRGNIIPPDVPANALGTRWLGFDKPQYGIHGTTHPELIGQQVSHGCIRMRNSDVEELFNYIPIGTVVTIND